LVENAITYSVPGGAVVVGARSSPHAVEFFCRDEGPGIPMSERTRVFEKFRRLSTAGATSGSGIGLSICKGLVEAHGGRIWVEEAATGGAMFRFTLPLPAPPEPMP
jgi:two-component system sensor histidine kinase KdpD